MKKLLIVLIFVLTIAPNFNVLADSVDPPGIELQDTVQDVNLLTAQDSAVVGQFVDSSVDLGYHFIPDDSKFLQGIRPFLGPALTALIVGWWYRRKIKKAERDKYH